MGLLAQVIVEVNGTQLGGLSDEAMATASEGPMAEWLWRSAFPRQTSSKLTTSSPGDQRSSPMKGVFRLGPLSPVREVLQFV